MDEGVSCPLFVVAYPEDWSDPYETVLKLRNPAVVGSQNHGGTALACELICSMLARVLGLDVPDYAIVEVSEEFATAVANATVRNRLRQSTGENFATVYLEGTRTWHAERQTLDAQLRGVLESVIEFDSTIVNGDRNGGQSNLLWDGLKYYPIDHSLALGVHRKSEEGYARFLEDPLLPDQAIEAHVCFQLLKWCNGSFDSLAQKWNNLPVDEILTEMRDELPASWEGMAGNYDRIFDFLQRREHHFEGIGDQLVRLLL